MEKSLEKKINEFVIFCLEIYKTKHNMEGKQVYKIFKDYKVIEYLESGYDVLHTQGDSWLMNDIEEYLEIHGYKN